MQEQPGENAPKHNRENPENSTEAVLQEAHGHLEKILQTVDLAVLEDIFDEHVRHSRATRPTSQFVKIDHIHCTNDYTSDIHQRPLGEYRMDPDDTQKDTILINIQRICNETPGKLRDAIVLHVLCHEETHAMSYRSHEKGRDAVINNIDMERYHVQSGFESFVQFIENSGTREAVVLRAFQAFNEGVVEKFAREVFEIYIKRQGSGNEEGMDDVRHLLSAKNIKLPYGQEVLLADYIVELIAKKSGVDPQTVWRGFVRGMIEGTSPSHPDVVKGFEEIFGGKFMQRLRELRTQTPELIDILSDASLSECIDTDRLKEWASLYAASAKSKLY